MLMKRYNKQIQESHGVFYSDPQKFWNMYQQEVKSWYLVNI